MKSYCLQAPEKKEFARPTLQAVFDFSGNSCNYQGLQRILLVTECPCLLGSFSV